MNTFTKQIPNALTIFRITLIPLLVLLMINPSPFQIRFAGILFIIAALTDFIDGLIARRLGAVSDFGKLLDPLADKILVSSALIMMLAQRGEHDGLPWVPAPLVVLIIAREFWVTGIRAVAAQRGVIVAANSGGKIKSGLQMVAIVLLFFNGLELPLFGFRIPLETIGNALLGLSVVFSYWAATEYTFEVFAEPEESGAINLEQSPE